VNYICTDCGENLNKWVGQCPNCQEWNTIKEFKAYGGKKSKKSGDKKIGQNLALSDASLQPTVKRERIKTHIEELDRVLGDGFFPGSVILFGGSPGVGKSTLALQIFASVPNTIYFSGEESVQQVEHRLARLNKNSNTLHLGQGELPKAEGIESKKQIPEAHRENQESRSKIFATHALEDIFATTDINKPDLIVIDSIQMVGTAQSSFGTLSHIRENAELIVKWAKQSGVTVLIIGHVTKQDEIAGPKVLEHMVDTVLRLEGEKNTDVRILRSTKNRFGSTQEVGVFRMKSSGLQELKNPSEFFLAERPDNAYGSVVTVVREGNRNFLLEVQVLTVSTNFGQPRRTSHGIDLSKFHLLLAVISKFTPFSCAAFDAYVSIVGGFRIKEPSIDLSVCAAILSSRLEKEIPAHTIVLGEVGLSGEVRSVSDLESRLIQAQKLGFKQAIVPKIREKLSDQITLKVQEVKTVGELLKVGFRN
jgi:DNA repair protein RadA/Sms